MTYVRREDRDTLQVIESQCKNITTNVIRQNEIRSQVNKSPHIIWFHLYERSRIGKSLEIECTLMAALGQGG